MTWLNRYRLRKEILASLKLIANSTLSEEEKKELKSQLSMLKGLLESQDYKTMKEKIRQFEIAVFEKLRPPFWKRSIGWISGIAVALSLALLIRQEWFELYEIPSGSMRPTLRESDRLSVSKTSFGVNFPFSTGHFWFDPALVKHCQIITFTGEDMDIPDVDTNYFGFIPGKRQFVKRIAGRPQDTIYFQGGQLYGYSASDQDLFQALNPPYLGSIDRVPVIGYEWNVATEKPRGGREFDSTLYYLMNEPVARLKRDSYGVVKGEWLKNSLFKGLNPGSVDSSTEFYELMGIKNYAQARIVWNFDKETSKEFPLVLEMRHHPSFKGAKMEADFYGRLRPTLHYSISRIPLSKASMERLFAGVSTGRFSVLEGRMLRYPHTSKQSKSDKITRMEEIPDGVYEWINGKAYEIGLGGIAKELPKDHPLYLLTPSRLALFFNLGYEFDERMNPSRNQAAYPNRFAYFRGEDLFVQGHLFLSNGENDLGEFLKSERASSGRDPLQVSFVPNDQSAETRAAEIKKFGLKIPEKHYLALGDNPPVSSDSRDFGLLPEANLKGSPVWIFWPPGERWGIPPQPKSPWINPGRAFIWSVAIAGIGIWVFYEKRKKRDIPKWEDL